MHKRGCDQDTGTEVLGTEEEGGWDAKARELNYQNWEGTSGRRYEENDEETANVKWKVVVWLC
jgi:hypothetical protein